MSASSQFGISEVLIDSVNKQICLSGENTGFTSKKTCMIAA